MDLAKKNYKLFWLVIIVSLIAESAFYIFRFDKYNVKMFSLIGHIILPALILVSLIAIVYFEYKKSSFKTLEILYYTLTICWVSVFFYALFNPTFATVYLYTTLIVTSIFFLLILTVLHLLKFGFKELKNMKIKWLWFILSIVSVLILYIWR